MAKWYQRQSNSQLTLTVSGSSVGVCAVLCLLFLFAGNSTAQPPQTNQPKSGQQKKPQDPATTVPQVAANNKPKAKLSSFDGDASYEYLKEIVAIGTRVSGSAGMLAQQQWIQKHFEALGAQVIYQRFPARNPTNGGVTQMANMIVRFHPERKQRLLFCCHYDTRPFPDADPVNPRGVFLGANDGASGVAFLAEMGKHMKDLDGKLGVDMIFFDGEEYVYVYRRDPMFLGSTHFAQEYKAGRLGVKYECGVLVDMIGDADLQIYYEHNSMVYAPRLTRSIWGVAQRLGVKEFKPKKRHKLRDDHLPLNTIGKIRTCDVIDFDFPNPRAKNAYWHTQKDTVEACSAESLGKVGWVLLEWLRQTQKMN